MKFIKKKNPVISSVTSSQQIWKKTIQKPFGLETLPLTKLANSFMISSLQKVSQAIMLFLSEENQKSIHIWSPRKLFQKPILVINDNMIHDFRLIEVHL